MNAKQAKEIAAHAAEKQAKTLYAKIKALIERRAHDGFYTLSWLQSEADIPEHLPKEVRTMLRKEGYQFVENNTITWG